MLGYKVMRYWDSELIYSPNIEQYIYETIKELNSKVKFDPITLATDMTKDLKKILPVSDSYHWRKDGIVDYTCVAKGLFIKKVLSKINSDKWNSNLGEYLINFGGDIYTKGNKLQQIDCKYFDHIKFLVREGSLFCSTNAERPNHIPGSKRFVAFNLSNDPIKADLYATQSLVSDFCEDSSGLRVNEDGLIENKTYIASPFFCETDVEIRDAMVEGFLDYVRPDLLNPNIEGDLNKDKVLAQKIKDDNISAIDDCSALVFPKNTTDLGTLYEVGYARRKGKLIIRYDYSKDTYDVFINPRIVLSSNIKKCTLDLNKLGAGILLGYYHDEVLKYYLGTSRDNIMLMNDELVEKPTELYPSYQEDLLSNTVYRLNTLTSGS